MKVHVNNERTPPISSTNNVTSETNTKDGRTLPYQKRRDAASSTDVTAAATSGGSGGGTAPTQLSLTPASRNSSVDVDSGVSRGTTSCRDGQEAPSIPDTKPTGGTKQGSISVLARGQKLLKHLSHRAENNRHVK